MAVCLEQGADLHMSQLMPLPLTVSCFIKIQIGFTFLIPADLGSPGKGLLNGYVYVIIKTKTTVRSHRHCTDCSAWATKRLSKNDYVNVQSVCLCSEVC